MRLFINACAGLVMICTTPCVRAVEISASGISLPFFNPAGKLTHRMVAKHAVKAGNLQNLREVEIHYFSPDNPTLIVQKVEAQEASWDLRKETLLGSGPVVVATEENRVTGEGFDFALATSLLNIHRNFAMSNREILVTSNRATVELIVDRTGKDVKFRDVKRCEAVDNLEIVVQPTATRAYEFDRARTDIAIYDGETQTVALPNPIRVVKNGVEGSLNKATINLKEPPPEAKNNVVAPVTPSPRANSRPYISRCFGETPRASSNHPVLLQTQIGSVSATGLE